MPHAKWQEQVTDQQQYSLLVGATHVASIKGLAVSRGILSSLGRGLFDMHLCKGKVFEFDKVFAAKVAVIYDLK